MGRSQGPEPVAFIEEVLKTGESGKSWHGFNPSKMGRHWIGIDVTHYAVTLVENRLKAGFPNLEVEVFGRPRDLEGARDLAARDKYQFQWWATWLLGAQAFNEGKKGADKGVDGLIFFKNGPMGTGLVIVSVKGGENVGPAMVRELAGSLEQHDANMGIFVSLAKPTRMMIKTASASGIVRTAHGPFPRVQLTTIEDLLAGKNPPMPPAYVVHNRDEMRRAGGALRKVEKQSEQLSFTFPISGGRKAARRRDGTVWEALDDTAGAG